MANLIQNNSKLIEQTKRSQINTSTVVENSTAAAIPTNKSQSNDDFRNPRTVAIIKDQSGFGFNVRGQISGELNKTSSKSPSELLSPFFHSYFLNILKYLNIHSI